MSAEFQKEAVSAVIPIRNGEMYIRNCFTQVQENLSTRDEAIFVVNGSNDRSFALLKDLLSQDKRMRVLNLGDVGLVKALNLGVQEATNNWIARFDVDDDYDPQRINLQRALTSNSVAVIFTDYKIVGQDGQNLGYIPSAISNLPTAVSLFGKNRTAHPSAMFSREAFISAGMYKEEDFTAEDLGLWLRMTRYGELKSVPKPLLNYRLHGNSIISLNRNLANQTSEKLLRTIGLPNNYMERALANTREILASYEEVDYSNKRSILYLHNLIQLSQKYEYSNALIQEARKLARRNFMHPKFALSALSLAQEYQARRRYRHKQSRLNA
jgi:glycosyltransferase involved in cell wall biosynthesis